MPAQINEELLNAVVKLYKQGCRHCDIARKMSISSSTVWKYLHEIKGFKQKGPKTLKVDQNYFKIINTAQKAYWLGFLYADGCVLKECVTLNLGALDESHVELFRKHIKREGSIKRYYLKDGTHKSSIISVSGKIFRGNLINKGCTMRKTFTLKFPSDQIVPNKLISHFIRGYFDGDGSVWQNHSVSRHGSPLISAESSITSSDSFILSLQAKLLEFGIISNIKKRKSSGISILSVKRCKSLIDFRDFLYKNAKVFLKRKKDKFFSVKIGKPISNQKVHRILTLDILNRAKTEMSAKQLVIKSKIIPYQRLNSVLNKLIIEGKVKRRKVPLHERSFEYLYSSI